MEGRNQTDRIAKRAKKMLASLSKTINADKSEFGVSIYDKRYSKSQLYKLPFLSKAIVDKQIVDMESQGHVFKRTESGIGYSISMDEILTIYKRRNVPTYKEKNSSEPYILVVSNLKGGATKTVSTVTLAHALRTHESLICEDLKILIIDLDPQASATMFLNSDKSIGELEFTACQAMLQNVSVEELKSDFIVKSNVGGVDVLPANLDDAFIADQWYNLCKEHLPSQNPRRVLKENIIDKLKGEYSFIFIDNGPHLDAFLENTLYSADILFTPIPPSTVDFHSTLKYLGRLPELCENLAANDAKPKYKRNIGFMTKLADKVDHDDCKSLAKDIFGGDMLDVSLQRIDAYERCGESFDTVISANPKYYDGATQTLKSAQKNAYSFAKSVFDRVKNIREDNNNE